MGPVSFFRRVPDPQAGKRMGWGRDPLCLHLASDPVLSAPISTQSLQRARCYPLLIDVEAEDPRGSVPCPEHRLLHGRASLVLVRD